MKTLESVALTLGVLSVAAGLAVFQSGCMRSNAYRQSQQYFEEDKKSYYNQPGAPAQSPVKRIQAMGQPKKRVMVFNFMNDTPVTAGSLGSFAADELRRGLFLTQRVIMPTDMRLSLDTAQFVDKEKVRVAQLIREGRRLGVHILVIGRLGKVVFRQRGDEVGLLRQMQSMAAADVEIKVFDVAAGREIMAIGRSGEASSSSMVALESQDLQNPEYRAELTKLALRQAVAQLVPDVMRSVEKMTWQGRVAKITGEKIYINAGQASGLVGGDILKVLTPGDDIYDPVTGAYLGRTEGQLKGTVEVADFLGDDGAMAVIHTGGNFSEGDVVRLY